MRTLSGLLLFLFLTTIAIAQPTRLIGISWTIDQIDTAFWEVERRDIAGGDYFQIALLEGTASSYEDSVVEENAYAYRVRAMDADGNFSAYSNTVAVVALESSNCEACPEPVVCPEPEICLDPVPCPLPAPCPLCPPVKRRCLK